jgi:hypothetical protein
MKKIKKMTALSKMVNKTIKWQVSSIYCFENVKNNKKL